MTSGVSPTCPIVLPALGLTHFPLSCSPNNLIWPTVNIKCHQESHTYTRHPILSLAYSAPMSQPPAGSIHKTTWEGEAVLLHLICSKSQLSSSSTRDWAVDEVYQIFSAPVSALTSAASIVRQEAEKSLKSVGFILLASERVVGIGNNNIFVIKGIIDYVPDYTFRLTLVLSHPLGIRYGEIFRMVLIANYWFWAIL